MRIKKFMVVSLLVMALLIQMTPAVYASDLSVDQTNSNILVNGVLVEFETYLIDGSNYLKLRDIAKIVTATEKQFNVTWDNENRKINLVSDMPYETVGGELMTGDGLSKKAIINKSEIYKDNELIQNLNAYTIHGNNFFKLRDLAQSFNIGIDYDATTKVITIETKDDYIVPITEVTNNSGDTSTGSVALVDVKTELKVNLKLPETMTQQSDNFYANTATGDSATFTADIADDSYPLSDFTQEGFVDLILYGYNNIVITSFDNDLTLNGNKALICKFSFTSDQGNEVTGAITYVTYKGAEFSVTLLYSSDNTAGTLAKNLQTCIDSITVSYE